jgi:four helix bundle protein
MEDGKRRRSGVIRGFRDLEVYEASRRQAFQIFRLTQGFPRDERFSLTDQIRRSSRAVGSMIAEAWAKRRYEAAFISKLNDAMGEAMETQSWLDHARDCDYITAEEHRKFDSAWQSIGAMLSRMIDRSAAFCPQPD